MSVNIFKPFFLFALSIVMFSSCTSIKTIGLSTQRLTSGIAFKNKKNQPIEQSNFTDHIEFLDNIAVKPGKIFLRKKSDSIDAEPISSIKKVEFEK